MKRNNDSITVKRLAAVGQITKQSISTDKFVPRSAKQVGIRGFYQVQMRTRAAMAGRWEPLEAVSLRKTEVRITNHSFSVSLLLMSMPLPSLIHIWLSNKGEFHIAHVVKLETTQA